jgi:hypothetical protein
MAPYTDPGMDQMMSVEDCGLFITQRRKGEAGTVWDQKTAIAVIKDVSFAGAEGRVYRKTWGSRRNRFFVRGDEKVTGKFSFEAITPEGWELLRSRAPNEKESYLEITGTFTDREWTERLYKFTLYHVHIDTRDFSMTNAVGPSDMPFAFTAEYVDTTSETLE